MKLSYRQKAYILILSGFIGIFLPVVPGIALMLLGFAFLVDKKGRFDVDMGKLFSKNGGAPKAPRA